MRIHVLLFGPLADSCGQAELSLELPSDASVEGAAALLRERYPALGTPGRSFACAVNERYVPVGHGLREGDRLAFIPPVSGG